MRIAFINGEPKIIIVGKLWDINSKQILDKNLKDFLVPNNGNYFLLILDTNHSTHNFSLFDRSNELLVQLESSFNRLFSIPK